VPLELLAFFVHGGDNQSTTTVCYSPQEQVLYLTSQSNHGFEHVTPEFVHEVLDLLSNSIIGKKNIASLFFDQSSTAKSLQLNIEDAKSKHNTKKLDKLLAAQTNLRERIGGLWATLLTRSTANAILQIKSFRAIVVILTKDLFDSPVELAGFHGEARLVRFLYLKYAPVLLFQAGVYASNVDEEKKRLIRAKFIETCSTLNFCFGSSQGTCKGCYGCLDVFKMWHGEVGNGPKQWLDPLSLHGYQGTTPITKGDHLHAIWKALRAFRPSDPPKIG